MLLIKNGRVVDPKSGLDTQADVLVDGKKVVKIAENIESWRCSSHRCDWSCGCSWFGGYPCSFP